MPQPTHFKTTTGLSLPLPVFFPDATRAVLKTLDSSDIENSKTKGVLVNTYHLSNSPGKNVIKSSNGVRNYMSWDGAAISDSGGFQVMSLAKTLGGKNAVTDKGVTFKENGKKILFTPEISIRMQMELKTDMVVVLDDFTTPQSSLDDAKATVRRTLTWAADCKKIFQKIVKEKHLTPDKTPYLLGVVQGGFFPDLRKECTKQLVDIGFDGLGYGGWPMNADGTFNYEIADIIRQHTPDNYLLYGLGIGKPQEVATMARSGWHIFDCVLPTRDARHKRLYVYNADTIDNIDISQSNFYSYYVPDKEKHYRDLLPISSACDCLLCSRYSRSYLSHLFRIKEMTAGRLATIHNLRFYSLLMEKLALEING